MEFVPGGSVKSMIAKHPLSEEAAKNYTGQILEGLSYLHSERIIHRDLNCKYGGISMKIVHKVCNGKWMLVDLNSCAV